MATKEMLSAKSSTLRRYLKLYDPSIHSATVCSANKKQWMETVDGKYNQLLTCAEEVASSAEVEKILDDATNDFQQFLSQFSSKCITVSSGGEDPGYSNEARTAEVEAQSQRNQLLSYADREGHLPGGPVADPRVGGWHIGV